MADHAGLLAQLDTIELGQVRASAGLLIEQGHVNQWWACPTDCPCPDECEYGHWLANLLKLAAIVAASLGAPLVPHHDFYQCGVCGAEMPADGPCWMALELPEPRESFPSQVSFWERYYSGNPEYLCGGCLPLRQFKTPAAVRRASFWRKIINLLERI